jgi:hypothetical protein
VLPGSHPPATTLAEFMVDAIAIASNDSTWLCMYGVSVTY